MHQLAFEDDPTEEGVVGEKKKKSSVRELQEQVARLTVQLALSRPEHIERLYLDHRIAQLRIRDLEYFLRESETIIGRLNRRIGQLEGLPVELNSHSLPKRPCYLCGTHNWKWSGYGWRCLTCQTEPTAIEDLRIKLELIHQENQHLLKRISELEGKEESVENDEGTTEKAKLAGGDAHDS